MAEALRGKGGLYRGQGGYKLQVFEAEHWSDLWLDASDGSKRLFWPLRTLRAVADRYAKTHHVRVIRRSDGAMRYQAGPVGPP